MTGKENERLTMITMNVKLDQLLKLHTQTEANINARLDTIDASLQDLNKLPLRVNDLEAFQNFQKKENAELKLQLERRKDDYLT